VELTKHQRIAIATLVVAASAFAVDRFMLAPSATAVTTNPTPALTQDAATSVAGDLGAPVAATNQPGLADRLRDFGERAPTPGRTDAFLLPASMGWVGEPEAVEVTASVGSESDPKKAPNLAISSVIGGAHPMVIMNGASLRIGGHAVEGFTLVAVETDSDDRHAKPRNTFLVRVRDEAGRVWEVPFAPGSQNAGSNPGNRKER